MKQEKIIGILGGMGSLATAYYFQQLILAQTGTTDQDYYRIIVDNNTQIPDRTNFIINQGENPFDALNLSVEMLNQANITHGFMPCFTAHYFYPELVKTANFEFVSVFETLADYISKHPTIKKIGVLATSGTQQVGLFEKHLPNVTIVYPDEFHQDMITNAIYNANHGIKANKIDDQTITWLNQASNHLQQQGVDVLVAGCTEVSMMKNHPDITHDWLDPMMLVVQTLMG